MIKICDSYTATGVHAAVTLKAVKANRIPRIGPDEGGNTIVDETDVANLPH